MGTAAATWAVCFVASNLLGAAALGVGGQLSTPSEQRPVWAAVISVAAIWVPVLLGLRYVSRRFGSSRFSDDFGLRFRKEDLLGVPIGVLSQLVVLELVYWPLRLVFPDTFARSEVEAPARSLFDRSTNAWLIVLVLLVVVGAPLVEELLYRGLIFRAIEGRIAAALAIVISALWFGAAHGQPVQFPGLVVFGVILAACAHKTRRLGLGIIAHGAFNATTVAILLLDRT